MTFQWPLCLIALIIVPVLTWFYVAAQKRRRTYAVRFTNLSLLERVVGKGPGMRRHIPPIIFALALIALIAGMARPMAVIALPRDRANVMLVFDVSGSMGSTDMTPSRIMAARQAAHLFVNALPASVQVGVISFNNVAVVRAPLTADHSLIQRSIDTLLPGGGTAIGDGLNAALDQLRQQAKDNNGNTIPSTIVLLSDGASNSGSDPMEAARRAHQQHIKVNTVGVGARNSVSVGEGHLSSGLDEAALKAIADQTGGRYFYAGATKTLRQVYTDLSTQISWVTETTEISALLSALGVVLFLLAGCLSLRWFQHFP
ncbi:VWA domain-containing protein [Dictyobacter aurantiacus]|uniref:VWFA domain-containing protein n=1 Tax=Dictyobacter aurantiacus TaxID=1936993 RepID=A0A401ZP34_9CHLR|nr:VWA domain-containing protein [Dictyobacter aurantiacus]GCE08554.1 hypothetical protein KDAU_58830 [Dictyobacter aurantiacus]